MKPTPFEIHEHVFIQGPRARRSWESHFEHSHADGSTGHKHPETGPAHFTIDKDQWAAATGGLQGGGRKSYSKTPRGLELPYVETPIAERTFNVIFVGKPDVEAESGGAAVAHMALAFDLEPIYEGGAA